MKIKSFLLLLVVTFVTAGTAVAATNPCTIYAKEVIRRERDLNKVYGILFKATERLLRDENKGAETLLNLELNILYLNTKIDVLHAQREVDLDAIEHQVSFFGVCLGGCSYQTRYSNMEAKYGREIAKTEGQRNALQAQVPFVKNLIQLKISRLRDVQTQAQEAVDYYQMQLSASQAALDQCLAQTGQVP